MKSRKLWQSVAIFAMLLALIICVVALPAKARVNAEEEPAAEAASAEEEPGEGDEENEVLEYPLSIANQEINSGNAADLTKLEGITGKRAEYDPNTNTLILDEVTIEQKSLRGKVAAIDYYGSDPFTINIIGDTTLTSTCYGIHLEKTNYGPAGFADTSNSSASVIKIAAGATLNFEVYNTGESFAAGIYVQGFDLVVEGDGALDMEIKSYANAEAIRVDEMSLLVRNTGKSEMVVKSETYHAYGIEVYKDCEIDGVNLCIKTEALGDNLGSSYGVCSDSVTVSQSTLTINSFSNESYGYAFCVGNDIVISNSVVNAIGQGPDGGYGLNAGNAIEIKGKPTIVNAEGSYMAVTGYLDSNSSSYATGIVIEDPLVIELPENGVITFDYYIQGDADYYIADYENTTQNGKFEGASKKVVIKAPTVTVKFVPDNGTDPYEEEVIVGDPIPKPKDPTKEDHEFKGWYDDPELTKPHDFDDPVEKGKNYTLYAKWEKVEKPTESTTEPTETTAAPAETTAAPAETTSAPAETTAAPAEPSVTEPTEAKPTVEIKYIIVEGADSKYTKKSGKTVKIVVKRSENDEECFLHFKTLKIGDKEFVIDKQYTAKSGSTILELKPEALDELNTGKLNVTIIFDDGQCETTLTIEPAALIPKTGEVTNTGIWMVLVTIAAVAVVAIPVVNKKRKVQR
ncbi:MAG: InlB B-repeat-containing protein [Clostridiales bacterium]|nr:InlB B-repeat-containing protein [Clostridiales bacterium]